MRFQSKPGGYTRANLRERKKKSEARTGKTRWRLKEEVLAVAFVSYGSKAREKREGKINVDETRE